MDTSITQQKRVHVSGASEYEVIYPSRITAGDIGELVEKASVERVGFALVWGIKRANKTTDFGITTDTGLSVRGGVENELVWLAKSNPLVSLGEFLGEAKYYLAHASQPTMKKYNIKEASLLDDENFMISGDLYRERQI